VLSKYDRGCYNHAGGVTDLVIYLDNANHLLLQHLHDGIPPLDGQTCLTVSRKLKSEAMHVAVNVCMTSNSFLLKM